MTAAHRVFRAMAMSPARRAGFAKVARAKFDRHEAQLQPAIERALHAYLAILRDKLAGTHGHLAAAAISPDGDKVVEGGWTKEHAEALVQLLDESAKWQPILAKEIMPTYSRVLDEILKAGLADDRVSGDLVKWRNQWLASREQELVGVPDQITSQLRTQLAGMAESDGTSVDDARAAAQTMLDDGYPSWTDRAQLIARTETVGANNQGSLATWGALADATGQTATKTWLATSDGRTREDHAAVDGTSVGISDVFDVGGTTMNGPGDPDAGPEQVCNCRCTLTYDFPDGAPDAGDQGEADQLSEEQADMTAAAAANQSGVAVMLGLGAGTEASILTGADVPTPDAPGLHCTVAYLSEPAASYTPEQRAALSTALSALHPEGVADAFATAHFNPDDDEREPCAVLLVQSDWLNTFHEQVSAAIEGAGLMLSTTFPIWIPHVAIAYNADPSVIPDGVVGTEIDFNRLVVGWGGEVTVVAGDGAETPDPAGETGTEPITAAVEAPVSAPVAAPPTDPNGPAEATGGDTAATESTDLTPQGPTWSGVLAELDTPSSDGRVVTSSGIVIRPLPLTLSWQKEYSHGSMDNNDVVVAVGRILSAEVRGTQLWGTGDWLDPMMNFDAQQAMALVDSGLGTVSVDLAVLAQAFADPSGAPIDPSLWNGEGDILTVAVESELAGTTIVQFPAFATARITNDPIEPEAAIELEPLMPGDPLGTFSGATPEPPTVSDDGTSITLSDGTSVGVGDAIAYDDGTGNTATGTISGIDAEAETITVTPPLADDATQPPDTTVPVASLIPVPDDPAGKGDGTDPQNQTAPADATAALLASSEVRPYTAAFFKERDLSGPTPLTVVPETGEVYGHLATEGECHIGKLAETGKCVTMPHSKTDYADFHLAPVLTDEGVLDIGKITVGTGHALPGGGFANAVAHYDNTGTAVAVVRAYEDKYGIQVTGQIIHDTPAVKVEELMRSPLSGDWRARNGNLELCAALAVNTPGFPVRRPVAGFGRSKAVGQLSLVAAGVLEPRTEAPPSHIVLPSGASISVGDMETLVAAMTETMAKHQRIAPTSEAQTMALRKARARLALASN